LVRLTQRAEAERSQADAVAERDRAEEQRRRVLAELVTTEQLRGHLDGALRLGVHAARLDLHEEPTTAAALSVAVSQSDWRLLLSGHESSVTSAAFSPDGARIVTASWDKTARIWDAATAKQITMLRNERDVTSAAFSPDGARIVTVSLDKIARIWDAATAKEIAVLRGHEEYVNFAAFSPDGARIVTTSGQHRAHLERGRRQGDRGPARPPGSMPGA
jgi:hypothetical protein